MSASWKTSFLSLAMFSLTCVQKIWASPGACVPFIRVINFHFPCSFKQRFPVNPSLLEKPFTFFCYLEMEAPAEWGHSFYEGKVSTCPMGFWNVLISVTPWWETNYRAISERHVVDSWEGTGCTYCTCANKVFCFWQLVDSDYRSC